MQNDMMTDTQDTSGAATSQAKAAETRCPRDDKASGTGDKTGGVGRWLTPLLTWISRIVLGGTFIFSGVTKAIDPWGTVFKLHDYIAAMPDGMMSWAFPLLTPAAFMLFGLEILIGVALVTGCYRRIGALGALLMMLAMLPLTLWIAVFDPVADCGCFGDALILSNWQTFWKNVVLTAMAVWLTIFNKRARCLILPPIQWLMFLATATFAVTVGFIGYSVQPMIDFRPYKTGGPLVETEPGDMRQESEEMVALWTDGTQTITIPADSIPEGDGWEFVDRQVLSEIGDETGKQPERGLAIFDGPEDITEEIVSSEGEQIIVFMTGLPELSSGNFYKLNSLYTYCIKHDISMIAVASATPLQIEDYIGLSLAEYPIYTAEDTAIKEVVRGNPAVVYLKDGNIVWKNALSAIPTYDFMESTPDRPGAMAGYAPFADRNLFETICLVFVSFIVLLAILSHVPKVISLTARKIRKSRWVKDGSTAKTLLALVMMSAALTSCNEREPEIPPAKPARTILIYMVATNSLSYDCTDDIREILAGYESVSTPKAEILIYRATPGSETPQLCRVTRDSGGKASLAVLKDYPSSESSVSKTRISQVISDIQAIAPAPEYGLVLWSHATGWLPTGTPAGAPPVSYAFGDDYGKSIQVTELAKAIPRHTFRFIWMDCCLMGGIEVAYQLRDHCQTYVSYPTEILSGGAPYQDVIPHLAAEELSLEQAARATYEHYARNPDVRYRSCTISVTDTRGLADLAEAARCIVQSGNPHVTASGIQTYGTLRNATFFDFTQSYSAIAGGDPVLTDALESAMTRAVIMKMATPRFLGITIDPAHYSGLSCHLLSDNLTPSFAEYYMSLDWYHDVYGE